MSDKDKVCHSYLRTLLTRQYRNFAVYGITIMQRLTNFKIGTYIYYKVLVTRPNFRVKKIKRKGHGLRNVYS